MNRVRALEILEIDDPTEESIKKAYRIMALRYHPDKNPDTDAKDRFNDIREAYEYLNGSECNSSCDYASLLRAFLRTCVSGSVDSNRENVLHEWLRRITCMCEDKAIGLLTHIDKHILKNIYELVTNNKDVLHISDEFVEKMCEVLKEKFGNDERIVLHPFIDDLENIYKLVVDGEMYLVPLWHHHLVYSTKNGNEIYVDCYPLLPDNMWIDEYNHIHIEVTRDLHDIWSNNTFDVEIGSRTVSVDRANIRMVNTQVIICNKQGLYMIHQNNSYDICQKSNIYIHLTITNAKS